MLIIDIDHINTWPAQLINILSSQIHKIIQSQEESFKFEQTDLRYFVSDTVAEFRKGVIDAVISILSEYQIRMFHATRIVNIEEFKAQGLRVLNKEEQIVYVQSVLQYTFGYEVANTFAEAFRNNKQAQGERAGQVCFYIPRQIDPAGIENLLKYFGGEYIRFSLGHDSLLLGYLAKIGEPKIIVARYPFEKIGEGARVSIAQSFVEAYKKINNLEYLAYGTDIFIKENIPGSLIEDVLDPYETRIT